MLKLNLENPNMHSHIFFGHLTGNIIINSNNLCVQNYKPIICTVMFASITVHILTDLYIMSKCVTTKVQDQEVPSHSNKVNYLTKHCLYTDK